MSTSTPNTFIGRVSESERIHHVINEWIAAPAKTGNLTILGISGYGGVGKSFLLSTVLAEQKLETRDVFHVTIDGSDKPLLTDFMAMVDLKLAPRDMRFKGSNPNDDQFPQTRNLVESQRKLTAKVVEELDQSSGPEEIKRAAKALYRFAPMVEKIPAAGRTLATALELAEKFKVEEYAAPAADLLKSLSALAPKRRRLFGKLKLSARDRLAIDPFATIAEAYETDIRARLVGYDGKNLFRILHRPAKGINRLLLVLDDYESVSGVLGDFCVAHLFRRLMEAPYPTLVIIAGRDDLRNVHPEFGKSLAPYIRDRIQLEPFSREEAVTYLKNAGYDQENAEKLYAESKGYPFVLALLADFKANEGSRPAIFYQQFFERTTQWMTDQQKSWLTALLYLDDVNEGSVSLMLPDSSPSIVVNWFRNEASVRDTQAPCFRVDPYIRSMLQQHHGNLVGSLIQNDFMERGKLASGTAR